MAKKKWFLDYFCNAVAKSVIRKCCSQMELSDKETRLILERFCDKKGVCGCEDFYAAETQRDNLPYLDAKVRGWVERNLDQFKPTEIIRMFEFIYKN